jgi:hypothetical protein
MHSQRIQRLSAERSADSVKKTRVSADPAGFVSGMATSADARIDRLGDKFRSFGRVTARAFLI